MDDDKEQNKPVLRDVQLCAATMWLAVAEIAKRKLDMCGSSYTSDARFWCDMIDRATKLALEYMRAGLHKKREDVK